MPRERILGPRDQGPSRSKPAPPPPPAPPASYRSDRWRDPSTKTFHIFPTPGQPALCGVKLRWGWVQLKCDGHKTCRACRAKKSGKAPIERERVVIKIDAADLLAIDKLVGRTNRKQFIRDAIREMLARKQVSS